MGSEFKDIVEKIEGYDRDRYISPTGLLVSTVIIIVLFVLIKNAISLDGVVLSVVLLLLMLLANLFLWLYLKKIPKPRAGKIGFLISIYAEEEIKNKIKLDFVEAISDQLKTEV